LVSALAGSLLVHPTYFNRLSTRRRAWNTVAVTLIRVLLGLLPVAVCAWFGGPQNSINIHGQKQETKNFDWIVFIAVHVGPETAYALMLTFAGVILLLHIFLSLDAVPDALQHSMRVAGHTLSRFIAVDRPKQRMNDLLFAVFVIYWIEVVVTIERSLVANLGPKVRAQNNWGFGQVSVINFVAPTAPHVLFRRSCHLSSYTLFWRRFGGMSCPQYCFLPIAARLQVLIQWIFQPRSLALETDMMMGRTNRELLDLVLLLIVMMNRIWKSRRCLEHSGIPPFIRSAHPLIMNHLPP